MIGRRIAASALVAAAILAVALPASATVERQVILVIAPGTTYEDALRDPLVRGVARSGGIGLMTSSGEPQHPAQAAVGLGAGRPASDAPRGPILFAESTSGLLVDALPYREMAGEAETGLLGSVLAEAGHAVGYVDLRAAGGEPAMLAAMDVRGVIPLAFVNAFPVLGDLPPEFLAAEAEEIVDDASLVVAPGPELVPFALERTPADEILVLVVFPSPTEEMLARGDSVTPVVMARGAPASLLPEMSEPSGLTSDSTHRDGIVASVDVAPTVLDFLDVPIPGEMIGTPIRTAGAPPTDLHRRYLEWRGVVSPVGQIVLGVAILSLVIGAGLIFGPWRAGRRLSGATAIALLASLALLVVLVPASLLPSFSWALVLGALGVGGAGLVMLALRAGRASVTGPIVIVALAGLALVVADVASGWHTGSTPLLGGSALDGERFFGLGNPYAGIVLAGATLSATRLRLGPSVALLAATAAFAGLPFLGADVGGCITLASVAGLWYGYTRWGKLGWRTWVLAAAGAAAALAMLIVTHRLLPPGETHVSRAVSGAGGILGTIDVFWERLRLNLRLTSETPAAWVPVLGLPVWLWVALRPHRALQPLLGADPTWRRAIAVLSVGGMLGYVLNDTYGMAGVTFVFVAIGVVYPALALKRKGGSLREPAPATAPAGG